MVNVEHAQLLDVMAQGSHNVPVRSTPLFDLLGCRIVDATEASVRLSFEPGENFAQGNGVINGGIVATMLDLGMAFATMARLTTDRSAASIGLSVSFLRPVLPGKVFVVGQVLSMGRRVAQCEAELQNADGAALARAASPLALRSVQPE